MKDKYFGAHEFQARDEVVKISSERGFGLVFAGFFALLGALSVYNGGERWHYWFPLAALFAVLAYAAPRVLAPLNRLWAKFGLLLHHIISPLFLGIVFYALCYADRLPDAACRQGPDAAKVRAGGEELLDRPRAARPRTRNVQEPVLRGQ